MIVVEGRAGRNPGEVDVCAGVCPTEGLDVGGLHVGLVCIKVGLVGLDVGLVGLEVGLVGLEIGLKG